MQDMAALTERYNWHVRELLRTDGERDFEIGEWLGQAAPGDWDTLIGE